MLRRKSHYIHSAAQNSGRPRSMKMTSTKHRPRRHRRQPGHQNCQLGTSSARETTGGEWIVAVVCPPQSNSLLKIVGITRQGFTCKMPMNSKFIESKVSLGQVVLYRRVSTKSQEKGEYRSQLDFIKSQYPGFTIDGSTVENVNEVKSGCADAEIRMASGLGKCLRLLKRDSYTIVLVSNSDRIAQRSDIFVLIQKKGLGHRVFDASTGMCVDDMVRAGHHRRIEKRQRHNAHRVRMVWRDTKKMAEASDRRAFKPSHAREH
jgi:hypothetical protein